MLSRRAAWTVAGSLAMQAVLTGGAFAGYTSSGGCISTGFFSGSINCVHTKSKGYGGIARIYTVDEPRAEDVAAAMERDRKWMDRCKPVIRQDAYGVGRYHYAAPGCEFGKTDNY
jgi:hypothetical protein